VKITPRLKRSTTLTCKPEIGQTANYVATASASLTTVLVTAPIRDARGIAAWAIYGDKMQAQNAWSASTTPSPPVRHWCPRGEATSSSPLWDCKYRGFLWSG